MVGCIRIIIVICLLNSMVACAEARIDTVSQYRLKVTVRKDTVLVRTHLNKHEDLIIEYVRCGNDNYTPEATFIGNRSDDNQIILKNRVHLTHDSTGPITNSRTSPWHLFLQHGYCIPRLTARNHCLTRREVGSEWEDEQGRRYTLGKINGNDLYMLPRIKKTETEGLFKRDWEHPYSGYPAVLHHVSGAEHDSDIFIEKGSSFQIRPVQKAIERAFFADGKPADGYGEYDCTEFTITETLSCLNPYTVETWFPKPVMKDEMLRIRQEMTFCGLSATYNTAIDVKYPILFESYGCNQAKHLMKYRDYDAYVMLPRVRKLQGGHRLDKPFIQNTRKGKEIVILRNTDDLYDVNLLPDREISFLYSPLRGYKLGFASGLSLTAGINADSIRTDYIPMGSIAMNMSPANRNKMYVKVVNAEAFEKRLLPRGFKAEFHSYFAYFDPSQNKGQVYWYKEGDTYYIYSHSQTRNDNVSIYLPPMMDGLQLSVIDKTDGVKLKSKKLTGGKLYLKYLSDDANYIVIRANKK